MGNKKRLITFFLLGMLVLAMAVVFSSGFSKNEFKKEKVDTLVTKNLEKEKSVRAIIVLKEKKETKLNTLSHGDVKQKIKKERIMHEFSLGNALIVELTKEDLEKLKNDDEIDYIYYDKPVRAFLQNSTRIIRSNDTWNLETNELNLTGLGQTICVIDTGINYSHPDLGGCNPVKMELNGSIENYVLQSNHNYSNNYDFTWSITKQGYSNIAVHFLNISLEKSFDFIYIYDGNGKIVATYSGKKNDIWTPSVEGDTIRIRLKTDESTTNYGFYIDKVINGTTNYTYNWSSCGKILGGWNMINYDGDPYDDEGHGTHVAGIISANGNIKGVAPQSNLFIIKALGSDGTGYSGDIIAGIEYCINKSRDYNISVISMSLGTECFNSTGGWTGYCYNTYCDSGYSAFSSTINNAISKNISVVAASGNDGNETYISFPACLQNVTAVGSTTKSDEISNFSNRYPLMKLFAPGGSVGGEIACNAAGSDPNRICSTYLNGYLAMSGTSMATPHVAGAIAIINQYLHLFNKSKTPKEIESLLNNTGKKITDSSTGFNYTRINVYNAIISLDEFSPNVSLIYPLDNSQVSVIVNHTFKCNATDLSLKNVTFYLWNSSSIVNYSSKNVS